MIPVTPLPDQPRWRAAWPPSIEKMLRSTSSVVTVAENRAAASNAASLRLDGT